MQNNQQIVNKQKTSWQIAKWGLAALLVTSVVACTNPDVPQGFEGYIYHKPLVFGKMEYRQSLPGPASTGISWRQFSIPVDMRERTFSEKFDILTFDDLKIQFEVNTRIRLKPKSAKVVVELWGGESWYAWRVKEPLRTIVRENVMRVPADEIQSKTRELGQQIKIDLTSNFEKAGAPIDIMSVDVGSFEFPVRVTKAIENKTAALQVLEQQEYKLEKTSREARIRYQEARRVREEQKVISASLDPLYIQREAVQVYKRIGESNNKTIIVLPNTADGTGMPLVKSAGKRKVLTEKEKVMLRNLDIKYGTVQMEADLRKENKASAKTATVKKANTKPSKP